jgi:hypothetical protein
LNASELLYVWEKGRVLPPVERVLALLARAGWQDAESLTIGHKNRALLALRESLFGPHMACVALCPECGERLEFTLSTAVLASAAREEPAQTFLVEHDAYSLIIRQPQLRDLQAAHGHGMSLYEQCLVDVRLGEEAIAVDALPDTTRDFVAEALLLEDPLLDINLALECPACSTSWSSPLDLLAFLWQEIEGWGQRMLRTIHRLATAYGWSESDILAMSAWRRNRYLELLGNE